MHITRWGHAGPRVVLVHGGAQGSAAGGSLNFRAQEPLAEKGWQLIVPDRPGHGRSPAPGRPDDAEQDGALIVDLLEDGAHLVGHSFGACVILAAAAKRPEAVRSLTFIEPGMLKFATQDPRVRRQLFSMLAALLFSVSAAHRAKRFQKIMGIPPEIYGNADRAELARLGRNIVKVRIPSKTTLQGELDVVKRVGIPVLVITGGWNPGFEATGDLVAAFVGGKRAVVPSGHHFPQWLGEEFNPILAGFLQQGDRPPG